MVTYGRAWRRARQPRSARFGFTLMVVLVSGLVAAPFAAFSPTLGAVVAVPLAVGWYVSQLVSDWRAGRY